MTKYGKWITWAKPGKPEGIRGNHRMQACYINGIDELRIDAGTDRSFDVHMWDEKTLAYRLEIESVTHVLYGRNGGVFNETRWTDDTYKITYVVEDGKPVSCDMVEL
jgi:hypothetical protein